MHSIQPKFCKLKWPYIFVGGRTDFQLINIEIERLIFEESTRNKVNSDISSFIHLTWIPSASRVIAITTNRFRLFKVTHISVTKKLKFLLA